MLTTDKKLNRILLSTYFSYAGLIALFTYGYTMNESHSLKLFIFQLAPLLLVLPGLIKTRFRAHSWLCFIIMVYFIAYAVEAVSPIGTLTDWLGLVLSVIVFVGAMMSSRLLQRL